MQIIDHRSGLEVIDRDECLQLLAEHQHSVGRLAFVEARQPAILPVNYALSEDRVIFRTAQGTKLDMALRGAQVAFEIDHVDDVNRTGWSVLVRGRSDVVTHPDQLLLVATSGLTPWAEGEKSNWVVIQPEMVTGRRVPVSGRYFW